MTSHATPGLESRHGNRSLSRRHLIASGTTAGLVTLALPSMASAASVGGAGGESPTLLNATTFTPEPSAYGHPVGGIYATSVSSWRFSINLTKWTLPGVDAGKTDPTTLSYTYEISPNNKATWHAMAIVPQDLAFPNGPKLFGVWVSFSVIQETYFGDPVPTNGLTWTRTDEGADGQWDWVTNAYLRVLDNGTVIDMSPSFWLW